jgi:hypothetical protein
VASITPLSNPDLDADAPAYNAAIPDIVSAKAAAGRLVSFLDLYPVVTVTDLVDGIIRTPPATTRWPRPGVRPL